MHSAFVNVPAELRQRAYDWFVGLPAEEDYTPYRLFDWRGDGFTEYEVCPLGAVCYALDPKGIQGGSDLMPYEGSRSLHSLCGALGIPYADAMAFIGAFDAGAIDDLADAMGVQPKGA